MNRPRSPSISFLLLASAIACACSSSPASRKPSRDEPDAAPDAAPSTGGRASTGGAGAGNGGAGGSGNATTGGSANSTGGAISGNGGDASAGDGGDASVGGGGADAGDSGAGDSSAGDSSASFGVPTTVSTYGCFSLSGDGNDLLADGQPAVNVVSSPHAGTCDESHWISDNASAFSPKTPPTTISMRRSFVLGSDVAQGDVTVSFKADDAVDIVLNGQSVASCTPPVGNAGECQSSCHKTSFPGSALRRNGEVNLVEIRLINLQSTPATGTDYGYTAVSYSLCVQQPG